MADVTEPTAASTSIIVAVSQFTPPPLASTATAGVAVAADDVFHFFQHGFEVVESKVHNLQVVHALERLEGMQLNQVLDLELLKAAIHPADTSYGMEYDYEDTESDSARRLDAALDAVADWHLRDVLDMATLANALQDVPYGDPLDARALQRDAPRIRRMVHWEAVTDAVRPQELRQALKGLGSNNASGFSELDMRAAVAALRMDAVRKVLLPAKALEHTHTLDSSGMWTWESM